MSTNYDKMKDAARIRFQNYDLEQIAESFGLDSDADYLRFSFLGSGCRIRKADGAVECQDILTKEFCEADFNEALTVYDILSRFDRPPHAKGEYIHLRSLNQLTGAASAPNSSSFYARFSKKLDHRDEAMEKALSALGAQPFEGKGDFIAKIPVFQDLSMVMRFWNSDEEFPADLQFLLDTGVLSFMTYETVWYLCGAVGERILALMKD